jgi:hypothetical protein
MCYKIDKIERFLDCAFGSARNDKNARFEWKRVLRLREPDDANTPDLRA